MKEIRYQSRARKALRKMPKTDAKRIIGKVELYAQDPVALGNNVTNLVGREGIRLRVGNWRVIMKDGDVLDVLDIGPRGSIY